jgi:hypothetical protein
VTNLANFGWVDVNVNNLGFWGEALNDPKTPKPQL